MICEIIIRNIEKSLAQRIESEMKRQIVSNRNHMGGCPSK